MKPLYRLTLLLSMLAFAACSTEKNEMPAEAAEGTRTITVRTASTKTTIEYEGSDVSHLVWCDGDEVAYCTDAASDTFRKATVTSNEFSAEIPQSAQNIIVIYPAGDNEGKTLAQASATLSSTIDCNVDEDFDGSLLPMMAVAAVPANTDNVSVTYDCLASVIRFTVYPATEEAVESIRKITISANENLAGTYAMGYDGNLAFNGNSSEIVINVTGTEENLLLTEHPEAYAVVNRSAYTGVDVTVETDLEKYVFADGAMDLSHPERSLYRITLDLSTKTPEADVKPYFTLVTNVNDITDDGTYLIACVKSDSEYYITDNKPTDTSNYYWLKGVSVSRDEFGVSVTDELMGYVCNITKYDDGYRIFFPNLVKNGDKGLEIISQGGTGDYSQHDGEGKAWFVTPETADGYAQERRYWDITVTSDGTATVANKSVRASGKVGYYKFCTDSEHNWFTLCHGGDMFKDICILKLTEI